MFLHEAIQEARRRVTDEECADFGRGKEAFLRLDLNTGRFSSITDKYEWKFTEDQICADNWLVLAPPAPGD